MEKIVLIGAGGHCKVIIDIIKSTNQYEIIGITDNIKTGDVFSIPIIGDDSILEELYKSNVKNAFISFGSISNLKIREKVFANLKNIGFSLPVLAHSTAILSPFSYIKEGTCVMAGSIINPGATIGENCIINTASIIEHDCYIGDNVHVSPNASIGGGVLIGSNSHIGIGSSVIQERNIGKDVIIGAGAVVINDIPDNSIAVGVPAKVIKNKI